VVGILVDHAHGFALSMAAYAHPDAHRIDGLDGQTLLDYRRALTHLLDHLPPFGRNNLDGHE
jgi:hypothetical protein